MPNVWGLLYGADELNKVGRDAWRYDCAVDVDTFRPETPRRLTSVFVEMGGLGVSGIMYHELKRYLKYVGCVPSGCKAASPPIFIGGTSSGVCFTLASEITLTCAGYTCSLVNHIEA